MDILTQIIIAARVREAKQTYFSDKIGNERQNSKNAWNAINSLLGKQSKHSKVSEWNIDDESPSEIAEGFNNFSEIRPNLDQAIGTCKSDFKHIHKAKTEFASFEAITVNDIYRLLCQLPSAKATGIDNISTTIIKISALIISDSLTYIFNSLLLYAHFEMIGKWQT